MISYVSEWLKQVILLVLLATFLDMLIPNSVMQRYVRFVMSLLIILMIVSPLFILFQGTLSMETFAQNVTKTRNEMKMKSLVDIERMGEDLREANREAAGRYVEERLQSAIRKQLQDEYEVRVQSVSVSVEPVGEESEAAAGLRAIDVVIAPRKERTQEGVEIEPVEPVVIDVSEPAENGEVTEKEQPEVVVRIIEDLSRRFEIDKEQVDVRLAAE